MTPDEFVMLYHEARASAILRTSIANAAAPAMDAAIDAGFRIVEFTLTTPGAFDLIGEYSALDSLVVGAGTVLTVEEARSAVEAGAAFIVSPVLDLEVIEEAKRLNVAVMPGTHTPTEMFAAHRAGAQLVKLFPAPGTGPTFIKSVLGPLPFLRIVPTNGVHENNAASFLTAGAHAVGFTTALFDANEIAQGRFDKTRQRGEKLLKALE